VGQIAITTRVERILKLSRREQLILLEIGYDAIDSASAFVGYMSEEYGFSKSSLWYNLKRLKERKLLDFATKDEPGKTLVLTRRGAEQLRTLVSSGMRIEDVAFLPSPAGSASPNLDIQRNLPHFPSLPSLLDDKTIGLMG
jgi:DNA-binding PadR family transcriptional regulator